MSERTWLGVTQWSRFPWLQEASHRRYQYPRSVFWGNWSPTHWADRTRDWYQSYIGRRRNTNITSGTSIHTPYWKLTRDGYFNIVCNPRGSRANNWSRCAIISVRIITGDHISGQYFYPWVNPRSVHILSSKITNQSILNPKYVRKEVWNFKHPSVKWRDLEPRCSHASLPITDWGSDWRGRSYHDAVIPQVRNEALESKRASRS